MPDKGKSKSGSSKNSDKKKDTKKGSKKKWEKPAVMPAFFVQNFLICNSERQLPKEGTEEVKFSCFLHCKQTTGIL